jgi:hypothetical protein
MRRSRRGALWVLLGSLSVLIAVPAVWFVGHRQTNAGARPDFSVAAATPATPAAPPTSVGSPSPAQPALPVAIRLDRLRISAAIDAVGVTDTGIMVIPRDAHRVGWYRYGPRPGSSAGSAVIAGHIDSRTQGLGAFAPLSNARPGDVAVVTLTDGRRLFFRVVAREFFAKQQLPRTELFGRDGRPRLTLITCGGSYQKDRGGYQDNLVITATLLRSA